MQKDKKTQRKLAKGYAAYAEFLALVFQMFAIILLGVLLGRYLDATILPEKSESWFTIGLSLSALSVALYLMIRKSSK